MINLNPKYKVFDTKEYYEFLGYADTMKEVRKIGNEQYEATEGDCRIMIAEWIGEDYGLKLTKIDL